MYEPQTSSLTVDELIRSNKELEQFAFAASHDLQEPLKAVCLYLRLFNNKYQGAIDDKADAIILTILSRTERMQEMVQNMLTYARAGAGNTQLTRVDSRLSLDQAIENLHAAIEENSAEIRFEECPVVMGDGSQLTQLFQNLIGNAIKFRKKDEPPRVYISARQKGEQWLFSIQDNGIGVEQEHIETIFDVFKRLHSQSEYAGSGIGLALCKKTVEFHQGRIWAESQAEKGTTVYFTLPKI